MSDLFGNHIVGFPTRQLICQYSVPRCYYIAQSYEVSKKWKESIGLYDRVLDYCNKALDGFKQLPQGQGYVFKVGLL